MIAFEVALMMEPMTMMGACAGVLLNKIFPGWLITLMLVAVLGLTTQRTLQKGIAAWRKETAAAAISAAQPESGASLLSRADKATMGAETPADQAPLARACEAATALALFAFAGHATFPELHARMDPPQRRRFDSACDLGFALAAAFYSAFAAVGYAPCFKGFG